MCPPVLGEILGVSVNTVTADGNRHAQFKRNDLKDEKVFLNFFFHFWNLHQILNILKKG